MAGTSSRIWAIALICAGAISCGDGPTKPAAPVDPHSGTWDLLLKLDEYHYPVFDSLGIGSDRVSTIDITLIGAIVVPTVPLQDTSTKSLKATGLVSSTICPGTCTALTDVVWDTGAWNLNPYGAIYLGQKAYGGYGTWLTLGPDQATVRDSLTGSALLAFGTGRSSTYHTGTFVVKKRRQP